MHDVTEEDRREVMDERTKDLVEPELDRREWGILKTIKYCIVNPLQSARITHGIGPRAGIVRSTD